MIHSPRYLSTAVTLVASRTLRGGPRELVSWFSRTKSRGIIVDKPTRPAEKKLEKYC